MGSLGFRGNVEEGVGDAVELAQAGRCDAEPAGNDAIENIGREARDAHGSGWKTASPATTGASRARSAVSAMGMRDALFMRLPL